MAGTAPIVPPADPGSRTALLRWYRPRREAFPWRTTSDPYAVLVSEVMLQQTQAGRVVPAYRRFLARFPSVARLASASAADVLSAWQGLGHNRRAVALHRAAREIVRRHGGRVPRDPMELRRLPGVGPYTAAAVASIAFGAAIPAVDTNVRRVLHRVWWAGDERPPAETAAAAERWLDPRRPGVWNQALMDLGRDVCRPVPRCPACPLRTGCRAAALGAVPRARASRRQAPFEGSFRQLRGAIVRDLGGRGPASIGRIAAATGRPPAEVARAVSALAADGVVVAGPAALAGRPSGRVRLPG